MKLPLLVIEGLDISAYRSEKTLKSQLEAIDVKADIYRAYDSEGHLLTLGVTMEKTPVFFGLFKLAIERVIIQSVEEKPNHKNELREALINNLKDTTNEDIQNMSLEKLIQIFIDLRGFI